MRKVYLQDISMEMSSTGGHSFNLTLLCEYINSIEIKYDPQCGLIGVHIAP